MTEVKTYYVEEGNTVRKVEMPLPDRQERERELQKERERERRRQEKRKAVKMRRHKLYTLYLSAAVVCTCMMFVGYVRLQTEITTRMNNISKLESQITQLRADNSAAMSRIHTTANLNAVKASAMGQLGMVYANSGQIVYYDMDTVDYMSQYKDIP